MSLPIEYRSEFKIRVPPYLRINPYKINWRDKLYELLKNNHAIAIVWRPIIKPELASIAKSKGVFFIRTEAPADDEPIGIVQEWEEYLPGIIKLKITPAKWTARYVYGVPKDIKIEEVWPYIEKHLLAMIKMEWFKNVPLAIFNPVYDKIYWHSIRPRSVKDAELLMDAYTYTRRYFEEIVHQLTVDKYEDILVGYYKKEPEYEGDYKLEIFIPLEGYITEEDLIWIIYESARIRPEYRQRLRSFLICLREGLCSIEKHKEIIEKVRDLRFGVDRIKWSRIYFNTKVKAYLTAKLHDTSHPLHMFYHGAD